MKTRPMQLNLLTQRRWLRYVLWVVASVAFLMALSWLAVPWIVKNQLQKTAGEQLGRKVTVGQIDFKPWTLELTINDLAIASQDGRSAQFQLKRLYANAEIESLLRLAPVVQALVLESPQLKLTHFGDGKYDVDDILARFAKQDRGAEQRDPLRFALFNLALSGGSLDFDDRSVNKTHKLRDLNLTVPFLSNLESRRNIKVEPRLAFNFNGSRFDSNAQATPFAPSQKTDAVINLQKFDLAPYLPYIPSSVPVRLQQAMLEADLKLAFEQAGKPVVKLSGSVQLSGVKLADAKAQDLLAFDGLKLSLEDLRPLEQVAKISAIELTAPHLVVQRDASGHLNLDLVPGAEQSKAAEGKTPPQSATTPAPSSGTWKVDIAKLSLRDGTANWSDASITPHAELLAQDLSLDVTGLGWPLVQAAEFKGSLGLAGKARSAPVAAPAQKAAAGLTGPSDPAAPARITFTGSATDQQATVKTALDNFPLAIASPYLNQFLEPSLRGNLNAEFELNWKAPDLQLSVASLSLADLALASPTAAAKTDLASIRKISLSQAHLDLAKHSVLVGKLVIDQPKLSVTRAEDKSWMFEHWLKSPTAPVPNQGSAAKPGKSAVAATPAADRWNVLVSELTLDGGNVSYEDKAASRPVAVEISALKVQMKDIRPEGTRPSPLQVSARIRSGQAEPGRLDYRGTLQVQPLVVQGSVMAGQIPLHAFEPYFGAGLNIELLRADAGFKGDVRYAALANGPSVKVSGDTVLEDFRANGIASNDGGLKIAEELLNWKSLNLRGLELAISPGTATSVAVKETTLSDFFARVIVHEDGRINLQDLVKSEPPPEAPAPAAGAASPVAVAVAASASPGASAAGQTANAARQSTPDPVITIGPIGLVNGKVLFSDRFVKPNYSANLSELTGKLSAFSSVAPQGQPQLADLELRGRAEGTASLEILGKLNPLAKPLALDIKGKVRDLELPPLSPYSVKYAGYGIQRGKLSVDVAYLVLPDGQLTASNKLVLNQLTFGDKVEGAPGNLPVKLAVALLADRDGVIDINLPVSGSLNDPQFRLGPIIFKIIVNLIVKAITAPFSLLASAFGGGGDELSTVAFAPGSALLTTPAKAGLDKVAKALTDRPALKMTVIGTSSLDAEREAYQHERLQALLQAEKRSALLRGGAASDTSAVIVVSEAEAPELLKEVYKRADITKPRNLAGVAREITADEMQALLLANIRVTEDSMSELALQRGIAVKDYLGSKQLPVERLFLGAVKPVAADPQWSPRAELSLTNN